MPYTCIRIGVLALATALAALTPAPAGAGEPMPAAQQNAIVQRHCAVCHTDAARNGGLSLEHFDAGHAAPSLAAMMLSKLTSGVSLDTLIAAASDADAASLVARKMKTGAIFAAGIAPPDDATLTALITALTATAAGARDWSVDRSTAQAGTAPTVSASILREVPSPKQAGEAASYRLTLSCNDTTRDGEMQLAWAPAPTRGTLSAAADGKAPVAFTVEGTEKMGNGSSGTAGPAALTLSRGATGASAQGMPLPSETLVITGLFPDHTVEFPFRSLPPSARNTLAACFRSGTGD